jgi:thioredoxin-like negative regulator of GroEL
MVSVTTIAEFERTLRGRKTVVLFHASWCSFCRDFASIFRTLTDRITTYQRLEVLLDDEAHPLWNRCAIDVIPTVIFFDEGRVVRRLDGAPGVGLKEASLRQALEELAAAPAGG